MLKQCIIWTPWVFFSHMNFLVWILRVLGKGHPHSFISYAHLCPLKLHKELNRDGKDAEMAPTLILLGSGLVLQISC